MSAGGDDQLSLAEYLAMPENQGASLVVPMPWCPHLDTLGSYEVKMFSNYQQRNFYCYRSKCWMAFDIDISSVPLELLHCFLVSGSQGNLLPHYMNEFLGTPVTTLAKRRK